MRNESCQKNPTEILSKYPDLELTLIGLFCFEEFNYYNLKEETKKLMNVDLDRAEKTQIKKGQFIVTVDGKESSITVKDLSAAVENMCLCCPDFTSIYADISVGSVGSDRRTLNCDSAIRCRRKTSGKARYY